MIDEVLLNRYTIKSELGKGGMGVVYQAYDSLLDRIVAIKFLKVEGISSASKTRLLQEARSVAKLNHPNIVSVFDAGEAQENPFIVMELVEGKTLREHVVTNILEALNITKDICKALDHAHAKGIIHRDLKLENVIMTESQVIKLMDFGLARTNEQTHITEEGLIIGTFAYLAPELIEGNPASPQSDLYALGVILYELLTQTTPFQGSVTEIISQHLHAKVKPPSTVNTSIPAWVDELTLGLLNKRPQERPVSVKEVIQILEKQIITPETTFQFQVTSKNNNLPTQLTSFIGREKEIEEVIQAVQNHKLVTLTGPGGTGKTRLALQVAKQLLDNYQGSVWLIELASLTNPDIISQQILKVIDIPEQQDKTPLQLVIEFFQNKHALLILDNCEHLIETCAEITSALLSNVSNLTILATSREALGVSGEFTYRVPSLKTPDLKHKFEFNQISEYDSIQLFIERATLAKPTFTVTPENASFIAQICSRLDGIPLAIELATSRIKTLSLNQIAERLNDRFRLLTGGSRTALERHQTLRATIDWSYQLLTEPEKNLLRRLAVFTDGWSLESAEAVCGFDGIESADILDLLSHLEEKSLILVDDHASQPRYRILETIRQYAQEQLANSTDSELIRQSHAEFFADWITRLRLEKPRVFQDEQVRLEQANISSALEWSLNGGASEIGLQLVGQTFIFWWLQGYWLEWKQWIELASPHFEKVSEATQARFLEAQAYMAHSIYNDVEGGKQYEQKAIALYRKLKNHKALGRALISLAYFSIGIVEEHEVAASLAKEAITISSEAKDPYNVVRAYTIIGDLALSMGDNVLAKSAHQDSLDLALKIGNHIQENMQYMNLGVVAQEQKDFNGSASFYKKCLVWFLENKNHANTLSTLAAISGLFAYRGQHEHAARLMGASEALLEHASILLQPIEVMLYNRYTKLAHEQLGEQVFNSLKNEGRKMKFDEAIEFVLRELNS